MMEPTEERANIQSKERYVSLEAVLKCVDEDGYAGDYDLGYARHNLQFQELIREKIPTADVRPVVRAFWVGEMDGVGICSNCKRLDHIDPLATHCRYCGAEITEPQTLKNASQNADDDAMMPAI